MPVSRKTVGQRVLETCPDASRQKKRTRLFSPRFGCVALRFGPIAEKLYKEIEPYAQTKDFYEEVSGRNIELMRLLSITRNLVSAFENNGEAGYTSYKERVVPFLQSFYKNYRPGIDKKVFAALGD